MTELTTETGLKKPLMVFAIAFASGFALLMTLLLLTMYVLDRQFNPDAFSYWIKRVVAISCVAGVVGFVAMHRRAWVIGLVGAAAAIVVGLVYANLAT